MWNNKGYLFYVNINDSKCYGYIISAALFSRTFVTNIFRSDKYSCVKTYVGLHVVSAVVTQFDTNL